MKRKQTGFTAIEGLLILAIVGIVGFTGWYVWHSKQATDKTYNSAANTNTAASQAPKKATTTTKDSTSRQPSSDNILTSADGKVQVTLPAGWTVASRVDGGSMCGFRPSSSA